MTIYGVGLLAGSMVTGLLMGRLLGWCLGAEANIGGIGIAMLLLVGLSHRLRRVGRLRAATEQGIVFWSQMYVPTWWPWLPHRMLLARWDRESSPLVPALLRCYFVY